MRSARHFTSTLVVSFASLAAACAPIGSSSPAVTSPADAGVDVTIPAVPLPPASSWTVSAEALADLACHACESGDPVDPTTFFYGTAPMATVDRMVEGAAADRRAALGTMFASGYFGGLYLRGSLGNDGADLAPFAPLLDQIGAGTQSGLDAVVGGLLETASAGTPQEVRDAAGAWSAVLAAIAGYNRGDLAVLVDTPPAGVDSSGVLTCSSTFDCRSPRLPLAALDVLSGQRAKLTSPPDLGWLAAATTANAIAGAATPAGRDVWNGILSSSTLEPTAYLGLVDLSVGFLQVTQAAMLATLAGPTGGDLALARRGLETAAALVTWAGSYFLGLASPLPSSTQPTVTC